MEQHRLIKKRQIARAERMSKELRRSDPFSMMGQVRCAFAVVLFLICVFIFILGDSETFKTPINQLEFEYQMVFSVGISLFSVGCLLPSFRRHKFIIVSVSVVMLGMGVAMPFMWHARLPYADISQQMLTDPVSQDEPESTIARSERTLSEQDLDVYRKICEDLPGKTHYAIYMDNQTAISRTLLRETLTRLLQAEYTSAYTRGNGALFVVVNVRSKKSYVSNVVSRFGKVTYANPEAGVYEVRFSAEKANLVSRYSTEVLSSPHNPYFVAANISEMSSFDPMRVATAANTLAQSNVNVLRHDIKQAILRVLQDPWLTEEDTYQALIEALTVYAPAGDEQALTHFRAYFSNCRSVGRSLSSKVVARLIDEDPMNMVEPVLQMWADNPVAWGDVMTRLGSHAEDKMITLITPGSDIQMLDAALKYFASYGTEKAIPLIEQLTQHSDSLIRHKAGQTLETLRSRTHR